jgi:hypothetical protein
MGRILHRQQMRRQFGISQQAAQGFSNEDRNWLRTGMEPAIDSGSRPH